MRAAANTYIEAMRQAGISAESEKSGSYYDEMEVALIMDLLKVIDNAKNDLPLLGVMRSFLYTFNADEMLKIRLFSKNSLYYHEAVSRITRKTETMEL
jgi:ATP-dependent helicase/nuclease subunit A